MANQTIILITGANSGIGYAASKVITSVSSDYHVLVAGRSQSKVEEAVKSIKASADIKGQLTPLLLDVTSAQSVQAAAEKVKKDFGRVDVLINNAGVTGQTGKTLKEQVDIACTTNITGPLIVSAAFMPLVLKSKNPYSIFVSSGLGSIGMAANPQSPYHNDNWQTYRMTKSALDMIAVTEHLRYKDRGVKVFAMCPGLVQSNLRGTEEHQVNAGGRAGSADVSGQTLLSIVEGKRDGDAGKFVHKGGVYPW